jgi:hypothetical protein
MYNYQFSKESIEDISFLLTFLDKNKPWTSDFFTECNKQIYYKKFLTPRQLKRIVESADTHFLAVNSSIGLYIGYTEVIKKLEILEKPLDLTFDSDL